MKKFIFKVRCFGTRFLRDEGAAFPRSLFIGGLIGAIACLGFACYDLAGQLATERIPRPPCGGCFRSEEVIDEYAAVIEGWRIAHADLRLRVSQLELELSLVEKTQETKETKRSLVDKYDDFRVFVLPLVRELRRLEEYHTVYGIPVRDEKITSLLAQLVMARFAATLLLEDAEETNQSWRLYDAEHFVAVSDRFLEEVPRWAEPKLPALVEEYRYALEAVAAHKEGRLEEFLEETEDDTPATRYIPDFAEDYVVGMSARKEFDRQVGRSIGGLLVEIFRSPVQTDEPSLPLTSLVQELPPP